MSTAKKKSTVGASLPAWSSSFWAKISPAAPGVRGLLACLFLWVPLATVGREVLLDGFHGPFTTRWLISTSVGDTVCLFCFGGSLLLHRVIDRILKKRGKVNGWQPGGAFFMALSCALMPFVLPLGLGVGSYVARLAGQSYHPGLGNYRVGLGFGAIVCALFFLYRARTEAKARVRDLENANLKAQLAALTAEMNPHMLFNALNTIASLVHHDPDRAEETVLKLAEVYRGTLRAASGTMHSLSDEIRLCEAYLRVESARYGERLKVIIHPSDDPAANATQVPTLLLQPIVENAVRHGIEPLATGGTITISVGSNPDDDGQITILIDDDGIGFGKSERKGNGRAIANCKERLRLAYGDASSAILELSSREGKGESSTRRGTRARVVIPKTTSVAASPSPSPSP